MADGMAALCIAAGLLLAAGTLAVQSMELHQRAVSRYQAAMVGRQAMERWKAGLPLSDEVDWPEIVTGSAIGSMTSRRPMLYGKSR